jgi:hypothetical protein
MRFFATISLVVLLMICSCTVSKRLSYLTLPAEAARDTLPTDVAYYESKYGEHDAVYLEYEQIMEHSGMKETFGYSLGKEWTFHELHRYKYVILNPNNKELTTFSLWTKPKDFYIRIVSPNGSVRIYTKVDLIEEKQEHGSDYKFIFPDVYKGTIVEIGYDISPYYIFGLKGDIPLQLSYPCEKLKFSFAYPDWWEILIKKIGKDKSIDCVINHDLENKKKLLTYEAENIPPIALEPFSPYFRELANYLVFRVTNMSMGNTGAGSAKLELPLSWTEIAADISKEHFKKGKSIRNTKTLSRLVEDIIRDCTSNYEKLDAIVTHVQNTIKIADDWKDRNYGKVLKYNKGNGFEITGLTYEILKQAGIEGHFLLIHSAEDGYFDKEFVTTSEIDIPAIEANTGDKVYVVFPYIENMPIDIIPSHLQGQDALIISEDQNIGFYKTPVFNDTSQSMIENYVLTIDRDGVIQVQEEKIYKGIDAYEMRGIFEFFKKEESEDIIKGLLTYVDVDIKLNSFELLNLDNFKEPFKIKLDYTIGNLVVITPSEVIFQTGGLLSPISSIEYKIEEEIRKNPIIIENLEKYIKNININFPEEWSIQSDLKDINFENKFGSLSSHYNIGSGKLEITQVAILNIVFEPKEEIGKLAELIGKSSRLNIPSIVFTIKETSSIE